MRERDRERGERVERGERNMIEERERERERERREREREGRERGGERRGGEGERVGRGGRRRMKRKKGHFMPGRQRERDRE